MNQDIIQTFFRITNSKSQRIFLSPVDTAGQRGAEEVRPVVYSNTNKNYKIEIGQGKRLTYPATPPIIVFAEGQLRTFDYLLAMPTTPGYAQLLEIIKAFPSVGKGFPRVIISIADLQKAWPACPLLTVKDTSVLSEI